jgi:ABC-type multidrug transport system fused ATPase/permease subunit
LTFLQQGIAYGYLIYSVINGRFGIGSFTMYLAAINSFSGAMFSVMDSIVDIRRFSDYYDAVDEFMNLPKRNREGKTTMVKLLMRLYRPTEGKILLNGVDIQEFDFDDSGFEPSGGEADNQEKK